MLGLAIIFAAVLFNSLTFLGFFVVVTAGYFALAHRLRWAWLLLASCLFYMAFVPIYIVILGGTIVVDYFAGIYLEKAQGRAKLWGLYASLVANIGVLAAFKYWNWLNDNLAAALGLFGANESPLPYLEILLPIGLSFHTFQAMSYTIEVYRGNYKAERHFGIYALYVMFYPQLVAGPIERPKQMLPQFREQHGWDPERALSGLQLMAWGFFKKVVIADRLASIVDTVYAYPSDKYGAPIWIATLAFALQIYADFSGYTDIALGSAEVMGFRLVRNFERPYFATSVSAFWRRWHISLSCWFRDYVYIPLGGNRGTLPRRYTALLVTFLLSGIWHGAGWNFALWGLLNGLYLILEAATASTRNRLWQAAGLSPESRLRQILGGLTTFCLISVSWVLFRAQTWADARHLLSAARADLWRTFTKAEAIRMNQSPLDWLILALVISLWLWVELAQGAGPLRPRLAQRPVWQAVLTAGLVATTVLWGKFTGEGSFIYFRF